jgi:uncharacterized membrane protein
MRPPVWLIVATGALALTCLVLAIAETNLWAHYLIDRGEYWSVLGLGFILIAGIHTYRRRRLFVSLPLVFPWLLYPVITQGDQVIDNLSINPMRVVCQVLLAAIFAAPVAIVVLAARYLVAPKAGRPPVSPLLTGWLPGLRALADGRTREGYGLAAATLFALEIFVAHIFLGTLMVVTLIALTVGALFYAAGRTSETVDASVTQERKERKERFALMVLVVGVAVSAAVYFGFKYRPGAYQGSPSAFMDPAQKDKMYPIHRIPTPARAPGAPNSPEAVRQALCSYAVTLQTLLAGYHILDRNYTYNFHNELFLKHTPLITNYRAVGLCKVEEARKLGEVADRQGAVVRATLAGDDPLAALLDELRAFAAYNFDRAPMLERMSGEFERTPAGLQHAAHLYEGESKMLGMGIRDILVKYQTTLSSPATAPVTGEFAATCQAVWQAYAHHVVGF